MFKSASLAAFAALTLSATAHAGSGIALESILVSGDNVRVEFSSKIRSCGILVHEDGYKAQRKSNLFCSPGVSQVFELPSRVLDIVPGDAIQMCAMSNLSNCTDFVVVREAGDLNGDGGINVIDLMLMHADIMGEDTYAWPTSELDELAGDMNGDGEINVIDILLLIEAIKAETW